jgi:hypothetical protein
MVYANLYGPPDEYRTLLRLSRHAAQRIPELAEALDVSVGDQIHIYLAPSTQLFRELQPGLPPTWADATAWPTSGIIFLRSNHLRGGMAKPLEQVMEHELVHVLLGRAFAPNRPPSWLQEGLAQVMAGEYSPDTTRRLARGLLTGEARSLESLSRGFPRDPVQADYAYAQSADFISWLRVHYGPEAVPTLIRELAGGASIGTAMHAATGSFLDGVESEWRRSLQTGIPLGLTALVENGELFWAFGGVALIVGGVMRRRQLRRRLLELEVEEALIDELLSDLLKRKRNPGESTL